MNNLLAIVQILNNVVFQGYHVETQNSKPKGTFEIM